MPVIAAAISSSIRMLFHSGLASVFLSARRETRYRMHSPLPYSGTYGPTIKPGLIHLRSGLLPERKRRNKSSSTHPSTEPMKKRKASFKNVFIPASPFPLFRRRPVYRYCAASKMHLAHR